MRVIAGKLGGRTFASPKGHRTHPMSDKVRGAIFNMLGDISGLTVLDALAGSGALSYEALSRGARYATAIDVDKSAVTTIKSNAKELGLDRQLKAIRANASSWADNNPAVRFDIVLLDPPYDAVRPVLLAKLAGFARAKGVIVVSHPPDITIDLGEGFSKVATKNYGDAAVSVFRPGETS